jgi:hypothetical protein
MTVPICTAIARSGQRCRARALPNSAFCVAHSPDITDAQRKAWSARGGTNSAAKVRARKQLPAEVMTVEEIDAYLALVFRAVITGKMDPSVGTAASNIAGRMADLKKVIADERIEALEAALGIRRAS